jgi:UDP-N-acetylbacillosamine N-acetyltransferase
MQSPTKRSLVVYGAGDLAKLMLSYFMCDSDYQVTAFCVDRVRMKESAFCNLPLVAFEDIDCLYPPLAYDMFVAIGYSKMRDRRVMFDRAKTKGYALVNYVSSRALCWPDAVLGENNVLMPLVHVEPFVRLGDNNLFWSDTLVAHGVTVGNHNYFGAKCVLGGNSSIDDDCFVANGAVLINSVHLHNESHVLPGSVIYRDTEAHYKYLGNPARPIGYHEKTGILIQRG